MNSKGLIITAFVITCNILLLTAFFNLYAQQTSCDPTFIYMNQTHGGGNGGSGSNDRQTHLSKDQEEEYLRHQEEGMAQDPSVFVVKYPYDYTVLTKGSIEFWRDMLPTWEHTTFIYFHTFIRNTTTYIGMGEWVGPTLLFAAKKAHRLIGAEPDPSAFTVLKENVRINPTIADKIKLSKLCISEKAESVVMYGVGASGSFIGNKAELQQQKDYMSNYSTYNWTSHCLPLATFIEENDALTSDMFIKLDTEGAEKMILASLLPFYQSFPFPNKPVMFISFHGVEGSEKYFDDILRVVHLYKWFSVSAGVKTASDIVFHDTLKFDREFLVGNSWMDLLLSDRPLSDYLPPSSS